LVLDRVPGCRSRLFDPDNSNSGANAQKLQFSAWVNSTNDE